MGLIRALMSVVVPDTGVGGRGQGCSNQEMACSKGLSFRVWGVGGEGGTFIPASRTKEGGRLTSGAASSGG